MTTSCGNFLKRRDKRVRQEHSDLYYCTKCVYFSLKCTKIVSSWGSTPYRPRWGAYISSCMRRGEVDVCWMFEERWGRRGERDEALAQGGVEGKRYISRV